MTGDIAHLLDRLLDFTMPHLVAVPILVPMFTAALMLLLGEQRRRIKSALTVVSGLIGLIAALALLLGWFVFDSLSQPGVGDLPGNFQEVATYRNENNTGPIVRVYAVTVADTLWHTMRQYGDFMPHTKYGNTKVYFFRQGQPVPKAVRPGAVNFDAEFNPYCLAKYEKEVLSNVTFQRYPLR